MPKVLISDELSETAVNIFKERGVDVTYEPKLGKDKAKLEQVIGLYDGLAVRSATKATAAIIAAGKNLKVIGRAGIGVDNIDIPAATSAGSSVTPIADGSCSHAPGAMRPSSGNRKNAPPITSTRPTLLSFRPVTLVCGV